MILLLAIYYLTSHGTQALPIQEIGKRAESCVDLSQCRTIWDIIWSCFAIIFSCTWLAIHPNIPDQEEGMGWRVIRQVGIFILAVIAPELIIWWAMQQLWAARELQKKYKKFNWTRTHGFFALMGGFMLYKDDTPQYTLDPWELEPYLISGQIKITEDEIRDKSKGDILTKGFVVFQTTWFIFQLAARVHQHLSITGLEVTTLAYASLNFITYDVWWNKPLNVEAPIRVYSNKDYYRHSVENVTEGSSGEGEMGNGGVDPEPLNLAGTYTLVGQEVDEGGDTNGSTDRKKHLLRSFKPFEVLKNLNIRDAFQPPADSLPSKLWHKYPYLLVIFPFILMAAPFRDPKLKRGAKRVPTFYAGRINDIRQDVTGVTIIYVTVVTVIFGAIHCAAWAYPFPSAAEVLMWRISSMFITFAPLATLVITLLAKLDLIPQSLSMFFYGTLIMITWIFYPLARLILLVQALIALRSIPSNAYTTVEWTTYIPHI